MSLQIKGLCARISSTIALDEIEFTVASGQITAIIGPNGAGKTSLLRAICGDLPISKGEVLFNKIPASQWPLEQRAQCMAVLPQQSLLEFPFSAHEVVTMGRIPHSSAARENNAIVNAALALVDCQHLAERSWLSLSGGEKQRVQLARVAAQVWQPTQAGQRFILLDEPSASLDLAHQEMVVELLRFFAQQGVAILVVLHDLNLAAKSANNIVVLEDGKMAANGPPNLIITEALLKDVFNANALVQLNPLDGTPLVIT